jgi:hypothetical protein
LEGIAVKAFLFCASFFLLVISCQKDATGINGSVDQIKFSTDKSFYTQSDTIEAKLTNNSNVNIIFETRTGCLIMYYQKKEKDAWSDILYFYFSSLRGPSIADTLKPNSSFTQSMPPNILNSTGTFRLVVDLIEIEGSTSETNDDTIIFSNSFRIE